MRDSAVPDTLVKAILEVEDASEQALDRWEKPFREPGAVRSRKTRQTLGYASRRLREAARRAAEDGLGALDDPRHVNAMISFLEAMGECFRAEEKTGVDFTAWLPLYMRDDPFEPLQDEIGRLRRRIAELEHEERAREVAARADRREAAKARLTGKRGRPMTTEEYAALSSSERAEIERAFGLDETAELRKFGGEYRDDLAA